MNRPRNRIGLCESRGTMPVLAVLGIACVLSGAFVTSGCHRPQSGAEDPRPTAPRKMRSPIRHVFCIYDQKPWLNMDAAGDRDPEGIQYRAFLLPGTDKGVQRDGTFHIEMYRIDRKSPGEIERTLVSDWHYPTTAFQPVKGKVLGMGYHIRLRWATKDIAGREIELITQYEDTGGNVVRSGTKRLRVPRYHS